jgi:hypothetical protein
MVRFSFLFSGLLARDLHSGRRGETPSKTGMGGLKKWRVPLCKPQERSEHEIS